jgi:transposase InsO family protein
MGICGKEVPMPWQEVKPMDQRVLFIADWLRQILPISELCAQYTISRKTGYKWIERYRQAGVEGLCEASRKPHISPQQTPYTVRQAILQLRHRGRVALGPKKIQALLQQRFPNESTPSRTTIYNILHAEGLVIPQRRRQRVSPFPQPFAPVDEVNDVWSADFKGQFRLQNGSWCYPLTVMDHHSRYLLCCQALEGPRLEDTQRAFQRLFKEFGLPRRIRTDNGVPFATTTPGGLSCLAVWWITLGILPERIEPGKPQQNARHERMHRTLKQAATNPPGQGLSEQQHSFDGFLHSYNQDRPHESLGQRSPASCYQPSSRLYVETPKLLTYPDYCLVRRVQNNGVVYCRNHMVYVSQLLPGYDVGLNEIAQGVWEVYFGPVRLGCFDEKQAQRKSASYITLKTVTHVP